MINVLMINKLFHPVVGGIEITITQLCKGISKDPNFNVTVLAGNEQKFSKSQQYNWGNANIIKLSSLGILFSTPITLKFPKALKKLIHENDVLHFHVPNPIGDLSFLLNKIPANKKIIVTVHADVAQTQKKILAPAYNYLLKKLLNRADIITTSAPQNTEGFSILKNYQHKCVNIPLAYDEANIQAISTEQQDDFIQKIGLDKNKKTILFTGRLVYYKGLTFLIDAIKTLQNIQLVIVGDGKLSMQLKQQAENLGIAERIFFVGKLLSEMLAAAYSVADIFVLPSITKAETFGIVQAEAMAYGLPIVNTNLNTGVNFVSIDNETGITVPIKNSLALSEAISKILNDDVLRKQFAENALSRSALFSNEQMVEAFKKLYMS